jgi:putative intracellular protease/amidase
MKMARVRMECLLAAIVLSSIQPICRAQQPQQPPPALKKLGILIFPGVEVIDFTGPYEVLFQGRSKGKRLFDVVTIGLGPEMIKTSPPWSGLKITPDYSIDNAPKLDILLIPGGEIGSVDKNEKAMAWIAKTVDQAECVMSVCNGAFILAKGGHLKGQSVTTFYWFLEALKKDEPSCTIAYDQRFTDNGKIITTAGLSSGIDGALHLIERYGSRFDAEQAALGLEYNWQPDLNWSRAGLADRHLIKMLGAKGFEFPEGSETGWTVVENNGNVETWTKRWTFTSEYNREKLVPIFETQMAKTWTRIASRDGVSRWSFKDEKGRAWTAKLDLKSQGARAWTAAISLSKSRQSASPQTEGSKAAKG